MNAVQEALATAKGYIEKGWTRGAMARDAEGDVVHARSPNAVCWCAFGAIWASASPRSQVTEAAGRVLQNALGEKDGTTHVPSWNDKQGRTQEQVLEMFDEAIRYAEQHCG